ncbi:hypothetical protein Rleg_1586 [Rhizobium leguminosarum bv. trifolii WSM1325]|uniref:Type II CBASS E2 protein domain-containing protein n=1 Tax=Rhizobium leguminosarum bv. trifolii (strain WSM1325) TaxID=395491 RepID=C6AVR3_RHILS|nr:hypothetical protein Rleg_1586 [Rhizobium leguminosarum bv. trifolii WSM1325]
MTFDGKWFATWEGTLAPISQTYRIWIRYLPNRFWDEVTLSHPYITVKVLDPLIAPDARGTGERTPHVYRYRQPDHSPALCAWDPTDEPFSPSVYIGDHVIPAVVRWLVFYEDWLDTGVWRGGGKHPDPDAAMMDRSSAPTIGSACPEAPSVDAALERRVTEETGSATSVMSISRATWGWFPSTLEFVNYSYHRMFGGRLGKTIKPG